MTTNMYLTMLMMVLAFIMINASDYPALQLTLAGIIYLTLIAMIAMEFWM